MLPSRKNGRPGFALGMALMVLVVIALMGSTLVYVGTHNLDQIQLSGRQASLRHTADGGLHELLDTLYRDPAHGQDRTGTGTGLYAGSVGSTRYSWTFNPSASIPYCTNNLDGETPVTGYQGRPVPAGCALLFVEARFEDSDRFQERLIIGSISTNRYPYAIASDGVIEVSDVSSEIPGQGHLLSNKRGGNPNIDADLVDGMTFSRDGAGSIRVDSGSGPQNFDQPPVELPNLPLPEIIASWSTSGVVGANPHPYGGPARYQYDRDVTASVSRDGEVTINGVDIEVPATVFVDGNFTINGSSLYPKGLHVFCTGNFRVNGSLNQITMLDQVLAMDHTRRSLASRKKTNTPTPSPSPEPEPSPTASPVPEPSPTASPMPGPSPTASPMPGPSLSQDTNFIVAGGSIRFNGGSFQSINLLSVDGILQNGSSVMHGIFYARNGDVRLNGNSDISGVVITRSGTVSVDGEVDAGGTDVTYDPSVLSNLIALNTRLLGRARTVSWWIEQ